MSNAEDTRFGHLSRFDLVLLASHVVGALVVGVLGFLDVDPDWAGLQRIAILMIIGFWLGGVLLMYAFARRVATQWIRSVILLIGPFIGLAVIVLRSTFG